KCVYLRLQLVNVHIAAIQGASVGQECGKFRDEQFKNNHSIAEANEHPWIGQIVKTNDDGKNQLVCVGILIDARHVLTSAHCVSTGNLNDISGVVFGDSDSSSTNPFRSVTIHPDYSLEKRQNDLAIIKLTHAVEFTDFVQPICLPSAEDNKSEAPNSDLIVAGFEGPSNRRHNPTYKRSDKRIKTAFNRVDSSECHKLQERFPLELICGQNEKDALVALSGSALAEASGNPRKFHLIGIVTVGFGTSDKSYTGYLKIRPHLDWILSN
ncbi:hypothetical protein KR084_009475, partial [Drosophila pseudotakahashii]